MFKFFRRGTCLDRKFFFHRRTCLDRKFFFVEEHVLTVSPVELMCACGNHNLQHGDISVNFYRLNRSTFFSSKFDRASNRLNRAPLLNRHFYLALWLNILFLGHPFDPKSIKIDSNCVFLFIFFKFEIYVLTNTLMSGMYPATYILSVALIFSILSIY